MLIAVETRDFDPVINTTSWCPLAGIHGIQQNQHINWLSVGFFVYSALFSLSYLYYPNPLFHQERQTGKDRKSK
ncbi:hypothetical protein FJT64_018738 [Amphibalanus amphitrite]|uniref:Uncharacterized protein n=1 Tax=Amphibalanus amphitrite TaxID=1232801 RepID=A0A6A4WY32_AMPAM|nr:hypothetical protein FJT64_018738 [Amphibalanus amphitrite]